MLGRPITLERMEEMQKEIDQQKSETPKWK
jgi:hypothetical protein